jgi:plastocyanin
VHRSTKIAVAAVLSSLAVPAVAGAATKTVSMGTPLKAQKTLNEKYFADANAFFPRTTTVHVGDTVAFAPSGFHNVDLPARGGRPSDFIIPGAAASGVTDAAGTPFWFNGQPTFGPNPAVLQSFFGKSVKYSGAKGVGSGLPLAAKPKPFKVTFGRAGTFSYYCDIHPGMKGTVRVVPKSRAVPSAKSDAAAVARQLAAVTKSAKALQATKPAANTVALGAADRNGVEVFKFFPDTANVAVGTTLTFQMSPRSFEGHTATTGPGDAEKEPNSYLGKLAASFQGVSIDPIALYPSDAPGSPSAVTPTAHGNGFWNSGILDSDAASPQPAAGSVRFDAPGTYTFYCLIHPFMKATVNVS